MICTVRVAIKNLLIKINWDSFCIRNILIVIFEFPDHFHLFIGAVAGDICLANCLIRQHSLRPLYVGQHTMNRIRISKYIKYDVFCSMPNMFAMCACAHREPSLESIVITVIVAFFLLGVRVCLSLNVCVRIVCCVSFKFSFSFSLSFSLSLSSALVGCVWVFVCLTVCTVYACVYLLLFWYEYAPGPFHFDSPHLSVCIDIFFPSSNHWTAASAAAAAVVVQVMCDYLLFSLSITLPCLLTCSLAHPFVTFEFFLCLSPYHSIKREYSP